MAENHCIEDKIHVTNIQQFIKTTTESLREHWEGREADLIKQKQNILNNTNKSYP